MFPSGLLGTGKNKKIIFVYAIGQQIKVVAFYLESQLSQLT